MLFSPFISVCWRIPVWMILIDSEILLFLICFTKCRTCSESNNEQEAFSAIQIWQQIKAPQMLYLNTTWQHTKGLIFSRHQKSWTSAHDVTQCTDYISITYLWLLKYSVLWGLLPMHHIDEFAAPNNLNNTIIYILQIFKISFKFTVRLFEATLNIFLIGGNCK